MKIRKRFYRSTTTQDVGITAGATSPLILALAIALCNVLGVEPTPQTVAAIVAVLSAVGVPLVSRLLARLRGK
jgi:hypothetical protein